MVMMVMMVMMEDYCCLDLGGLHQWLEVDQGASSKHKKIMFNVY